MSFISNSSDIDYITTRQKYLGNKGLIVFLALLSAFVPLATDLYLPALPTMTTYFQYPNTDKSYSYPIFHFLQPRNTGMGIIER